MNKILNFTVLLTMLLISCTREKDHCGETQTTYRYISKESLEKTQYFTNSAFDTISFTSNKGDTLIFVKSKTDSTWFDYKYYNSPPGCPPTENQRNLEITNSYETIKGTGSFKVKHSRMTEVYYMNFPQQVNELIEIYFLQYHFYFYEHNFNKISHSYYVGNYPISDTIFNNVFYSMDNMKAKINVKAFMAPNYGIIKVIDSLNYNDYTIAK